MPFSLLFSVLRVERFVPQGYAALTSDFDSFYTRRLKLRIDDCFSHPVTGVPGRTILLLDRYSPDYNKTMIPTGTRTRALNISSYNYLGFAQGSGPCADAVEKSIERYGVASGGTRLQGGTLDLHLQAEEVGGKGAAFWLLWCAFHFAMLYG